MKVIYNSGYTENAIVSLGVLHTGLNLIAKPFRTFALDRKHCEILGREKSEAERCFQGI